MKEYIVRVTKTPDYIPIEREEVVRELVRCKDCKWYKRGECENDYVLSQIHDCGCYPNFETYPDWFCAYGESTMGQVKMKRR